MRMSCNKTKMHEYQAPNVEKRGYRTKKMINFLLFVKILIYLYL